MEQVLSSQYLYQGHVLNLRLDRVRLSDGRESLREIAEHRGAVVIVALAADGRVVLVKQYRHAVGRELHELPAGTLEKNEAVEVTAPRELQEETGYTAARWEFLARFFSSPGILTEEMFLYLARDLTPGKQHVMDDEDIQVELVPLRDALARIGRGEIIDAKTIIGLLLAAQKLDTMTV